MSNLAVATPSITLALRLDFLRADPPAAAAQLETQPPNDAAHLLSGIDAGILTPVWECLAPDYAGDLLSYLSPDVSKDLIQDSAPSTVVRVFGFLDAAERQVLIETLPATTRREIEFLLSFGENTAGRNMETRFLAMRPEATIDEAIGRLRKLKLVGLQNVFVTKPNGLLLGRIPVQELATADGGDSLETLMQSVPAVVTATTPAEEVLGIMERQRLPTMPVVDLDGKLLGVFRLVAAITAAQVDATADLQTMVGASRDERALSKASFAVRKRMPWLQINLLTAFMAAAVVGLFEGTIAKFTALAVLLPVVAGQSGNAGAQALAVTMRGLALREISLRNWLQVTTKEAKIGLMNGVAIAFSCGVGVYLWSGSIGLVIVICISMVLAMVAAGLAGAMVPIVLTRFGQDPAVASSIILTTVTDIAGFFSFLGIATLLSHMLIPG